MLLEGRRVLVTGGSAGIGRAVALAAARQGANVAINHLGQDEVAAALVAEVAALGRRAIAVGGDVALPETAADFVARAADALGGVDVFVSNAGICPFHTFLDMPVELFERTMRVNLHGAFHMVQAAANRIAAPGDRRRDRRRLVHLRARRRRVPDPLHPD